MCNTKHGAIPANHERWQISSLSSARGISILISAVPPAAHAGKSTLLWLLDQAVLLLDFLLIHQHMLLHDC